MGLLFFQLETVQEDVERKSRQIAEMEAERSAWHEERSHIHSKLNKEKEDVSKHAHTITVLHSELSSVKQQVYIDIISIYFSWVLQ